MVDEAISAIRNSLIPNFVPVKDAAGRTVIDLGIIATFYLDKGWDDGVRAAVAGCFEHYHSIFGSMLRWARNTKNKRWVPANSEKMMSPRDLFAVDSIDEDMAWEFDYHSGKSEEEAGQFCIHGLGSPRWEEDDLSYLSITVSYDWFYTHREEFIHLVLDWCKQLAPLHGYAGLSLIESPDVAIRRDHEVLVVGLAKRFPGVELDYPYSHVIYLKQGLKGVNWLTIIGEEFLSQQKDSASKMQSVREVARVYDYGKGVVIQAGEQPESGDINRNHFPDAYRKVNKHFRAWRVHKLGRFHGSTGFDQAASEAWLARFDE